MTEFFKINSNEPEREILELAARRLKNGDVNSTTLRVA